MNKFEVRFKGVQIRGEVLSWTVRLKTFDAGTLIKHLATKGLKLNCYGGGRFADTVQADEWEDTELHGRIILGGTQQIGSFVVRELSADDALDVPQGPVGDDITEAVIDRFTIGLERRCDRRLKTAAAVAAGSDEIPF